MLDLLGTSASLLSTWFFIRLNRKAWLMSVIAISLNSVLYWQKGIYADVFLQFIYLGTTVYGWFKWQSNKNSPLKVLKLTLKQWLLLCLAICGLFAIIWKILTSFTESDIAIPDALTAALSLTAQWLMCKKIIATWILWFFTDIIYACLYLQKQIPFHALLMLMYTGMAVMGYYTWVKNKPILLNLKSISVVG